MSSAHSVQRSWAPIEPLLAEPASELDTSTLAESYGYGRSPSTHASSSAPLRLWETIQEWLAFVRGLTLAAGSAASCGVAGAGLALLLFLAVTLTFAPASDTFSRRLDMDFSAADLVADTTFLPDALLADGLPPANAQRGARFLAPLQPVDVWVELEVPRETWQGVAQLVAQLTSLDGRPAAKASRALMLQENAWSLRSLALAPLRWAGLAHGPRRVRVPLFTNYREKREVPFMAAHIAIKTRNPRWAAEVLSATLKVRLRLGVVRRVLYTLRPGPLALVVLGGAALAAFLGGGAAAIVFLALLLFAGFGGGRGGDASAVQDEVSSNQSADVDVSSVSDVSEASSSLLRELEGEEGEPPSPRQHPGMQTAAAAARRRSEEEEGAWYDAAGTSAAAAGGGRLAGRKPGGLADSAMGSDAGLGGGASVRRRRAGSKSPP